MSFFALESADFLIRSFEGHVSIAELEEWLYESDELETVMSAADYLEVISLRFRDKYLLMDAEKLLTSYIDWSLYYAHRLRKQLLITATRSAGVEDAMTELYYDYCDGARFLQRLALDYVLRVDHFLDWDMLAPSQQHDLLDSLYPGVAQEAQRIIELLEGGEVGVLSVGRNEKQFFDKAASEK